MNSRDDLTSGSPARDHSAKALACIVAAFAIFNSIWQPISSVEWNEYGLVLCLGVLIFEPLSIGMWTALGSGSIFTRLPIAVPSLMLLFIVPGYVPAAFADVQQSDFIVVVLIGFAVYAISVVIFVLFRKSTRLRIQSSGGRMPDENGVRFSIKYLLVLLTVVAVVLGLNMQLEFEQADPSLGYFGPGSFRWVLIFDSALLTIAALPALAISLAILHGRPSRPAITFAIVFWAIVMVLFLALSIIDQGEAEMRPALFAQVGASLTGAVVAVTLRVGGLRLVRCG